MAYLKAAKTESDLKGLTVSSLKKEYISLATEYNHLFEQDYLYCHQCGDFLSKTTFYSDSQYASGYYPICKKCILAEVEQRKKKNDEPHETKESVQKVLMKMDLPYIDSFYEDCVKGVADGMKEKNRKSPFVTYMTCLKSLPQYKGKTWINSEFGAGDSNGMFTDREPRAEIKKIFGHGFSNEDYLYLQDQYDDWKSRTQVDGKSQETYIIQICFKQLDIWKCQRAGKDTNSLIKSLNDLMSAANLQPRQNVGNSSTDNLTFGQLIEKWEMEEPIPEPAPEFRDVDGIGQYIRIWFSGWLSKAVGLKNTYTEEFDEYMKRYTVTKPEYTDEENSEGIYEKLFGVDGD